MHIDMTLLPIIILIIGLVMPCTTMEADIDTGKKILEMQWYFTTKYFLKSTLFHINVFR